jgi:hypothetical protein
MMVVRWMIVMAIFGLAIMVVGCATRTPLINIQVNDSDNVRSPPHPPSPPAPPLCVLPSGRIARCL